MRNYLLVIALLFSVFAASAQTTLLGKVVDGNKKVGVGYATVALLRDTVIVSAVAARNDGTFSLDTKEQGEMVLEVSSVGYTTAKQSVKVAGKYVDMGEIAITEGVEVDAVAVTIQKPIVTADAEKLTYSVEDDPEASTSTLEDIIRKVPQLSLDAEGKVLMNGQSDYKILVNGHPSSSMSRNFADIIKSMPASSIKRIEVVTNPSMKYDAEGVGGVLNIITTKAKFDGYNGRVNLAAGNWFNRNWSTNNSAQFTVQTEKLSLSTAFYYSQAWANKDAVGYQTNRLENLVDGSAYRYLNLDADYGYGYYSLYGNVNASYQIDSVNLVTAEVGVWGGKQNVDIRGRYNYFDDSNNPIYGYNSPQTNSNNWIGVDATVSYQHSFKGEGHTLTVSDNISIIPPQVSNQLKMFEPLGGIGTESQIATEQTATALQNVAQIDYINPIHKHHTIEAGAKHSYDNTQTITDQANIDGLGATLSESSGTTRLTRNVLGVYAGYAYSIGKFSARAGGRLEGAWYATDYQSDKREKWKTSLVNVIPYISLTYLPKVGHTLAFSYTERLSRPGINAMTPFVTESLIDRQYGNPKLRTGVTHNLSLKYAYTNNKLSATGELYSRLSNNLISTYSFIDDEGFVNSTYRNHGRLRGYGAGVSLSYRPSAKFNLSLSVRGGHIAYRLTDEGIESKGWTMSQNLNMMIALWKGARLTLSEYLLRIEPQMGRVGTNWILGTQARLGQKLLKDKLEIAVAVYNPHARTTTFKQLAETPTYRQWASNSTVGRCIRLSVSYNFGKQGLYVKRTNAKSDDGGDNIGGTSTGASEM
ncbi:MAG: outer membrane beta-barrel protein [Alistipes sp.]|nr:outer membrane beta-barrel protein [Alistipes sp.]